MKLTDYERYIETELVKLRTEDGIKQSIINELNMKIQNLEI